MKDQIIWKLFIRIGTPEDGDVEVYGVTAPTKAEAREFAESYMEGLPMFKDAKILIIKYTGITKMLV